MAWVPCHGTPQWHRMPPLCRRIEALKLGRLGQTKLVYDAGWDLFAYVGLSQQLRIKEGGTTRTVGLDAIVVSCLPSSWNAVLLALHTGFLHACSPCIFLHRQSNTGVIPCLVLHENHLSSWMHIGC